MNHTRTVRVALLGAGSVGSQVARTLLAEASEFTARTGAKLELAGIAVRSLDAPRDVPLPAELLTTDAKALIAEADLVVELIGGIEPARSLILDALSRGVAVVTANKALLAAHGPELFAAAREHGAQLSFEAAVAGAIPIIKPLLESLAGDRVERVMGIVNGSTNYILDSMDTEGKTTAAAMAMARALGYLEADPTLDVEGFDAAQKAAILARLAFHTELPESAVYREGITGVSAAGVAAAQQNNQVIKLLAVVERVDTAAGVPGVSARVYPALISREHPLAAVHGGKNAIFVEAENAGELMFYGAGAGGAPTASAVLGDVLQTARNLVSGAAGVLPSAHAQLTPVPITEIHTAYQVRLTVVDSPGVLAQVAQVLANNSVSVASIHQQGVDAAGEAQVLLCTSRATEGALRQMVAQLGVLDTVLSVDGVLRVEGGA